MEIWLRTREKNSAVGGEYFFDISVQEFLNSETTSKTTHCNVAHALRKEYTHCFCIYKQGRTF